MSKRYAPTAGPRFSSNKYQLIKAGPGGSAGQVIFTLTDGIALLLSALVVAGFALGLVAVVQNSSQSDEVAALQNSVDSLTNSTDDQDMMITMLKNQTGTLETELTEAKMGLMMAEVDILELQIAQNMSEVAFSFIAEISSDNFASPVTGYGPMLINAVLIDTMDSYNPTNSTIFPLVQSGIYSIGVSCNVPDLEFSARIEVTPFSAPPCEFLQPELFGTFFNDGGGSAVGRTTTLYTQIPVDVTAQPGALRICSIPPPGLENAVCRASGMKISDLIGNEPFTFPLS